MYYQSMISLGKCNESYKVVDELSTRMCKAKGKYKMEMLKYLIWWQE